LNIYGTCPDKYSNPVRFESAQGKARSDIQKLSTGEDNSMSRWDGMQRFPNVIFSALSAYLPLWDFGISIFGFTDFLLSA
jgi:hypothetical protein